jgi:hypothetical protein
MAVAVTNAQSARSISGNFGGNATWAFDISSVASGARIVVGLSWANVARTISSVTANGDTPTNLEIHHSVTNGTYVMRHTYASGVLQSACTSITVTLNSTLGDLISNWVVLTVTGLAASPGDENNYALIAADSSGSFSSGTITPSVPDALLLGIIQCSTNAGYLNPGGWTSVQQDVNCAIGYKIVSSTDGVAYTPTATATSESGLVSIQGFVGEAVTTYDLSANLMEPHGGGGVLR